MTQFERDTRVGRLRIRATVDDELALAMRGEAALRPLDLRPPGMPHHAILCIRRMDDPLPRAIDLRTAHPPRPTEWERAARGVIAEAFRRAVRVRDSVVPEDAGAVVFEDRAVLLAAAALDAIRGRLDQWYWKKLLRVATLEGVLHEWQSDGVYVAAAIELLANDAVAFVRSIEATRATALATALLRTAQAPHLPPLWRAIAPEAADATLHDEQRTLLAIALILRRAPNILRTEHEPQQAPREGRCRTAESPKKRVRPSRREVPSMSESAEKLGSAPEATRRQRSLSAAPKPARRATAKLRDRATTRRDPAIAWRNRATILPAIPLQPRNPATSEPSTSERRHAGTDNSATDNEQPATAQPIHSTHAGAFFLLNLVEWRYLRLTARMLSPSVEDDEVWPLLRIVRSRPNAGRKTSVHDILRALQTVARARITLAKRTTPPSLLIQQRGSFVITPVHLDVTFSLERHPIEIRMAGLDRDPGWIAAIGRHVAFHFD